MSRPAHTAHGHWLREAGPVHGTEPARGDLAADVVVVGGGYTGMWAAWHLTELDPSLRVVLLESGRCGHGPSGRNGGFCHGTWLGLAAHRDAFGPGRALALAEAAQDAAEAVGRWCEDQGVDAWFRRGGELRVSTAPAHDDVGLAAVRAAEELGVPERIVALSPAEVAEHVRSPVFRRGVYAPDGATVHPARLALGLRARLLDRGVAVHEGTRVTSVRGRGSHGVTVHARGAQVRARSALMAAGGSMAALAPLRGRLLVGSSHMVVTEPVPDVLEEIGWTGGEAVSDARAFLHYLRTTRDGRIAFGWAGGHPAFGRRLGGRIEVDRALPAVLRAHMLRMFPALEGRAVEHAWGGPIDITPQRLPAVVGVPGGPIHAAAGYTGNGVGPSHLVGRILALLALDQRGPLTSLPIVEPADGAGVPPEPLRWAGAELTRRAILQVEDAEEAGRRAPLHARALATLPGRLGITLGR